jgi:hypothetical protein
VLIVESGEHPLTVSRKHFFAEQAQVAGSERAKPTAFGLSIKCRACTFFDRDEWLPVSRSPRIETTAN